MRISRTRASLALAVCGFGALGLAACMSQAPAPAPLATTTPQLGLFYMDEGPSAKLAYGQANSDNVGLMLQCARGSRMVDVSDLMVAPDGRAPSTPSRTLLLTSGTDRATLSAERADGDGATFLVARTRADTGPLANFRRTGRMTVGSDARAYPIAAKPGERAAIEQFFSACEAKA